MICSRSESLALRKNREKPSYNEPNPPNPECRLHHGGVPHGDAALFLTTVASDRFKVTKNGGIP